MSVSAVRTEPEISKDPKEQGEQTRSATLNGELLRGVQVALEVRLGEAVMTVEEMLALKSGAVVTLDTALADHVDLYLNNNIVARGEIVAVGDKFGIKIVEIAPAR